MENTKKAVGQLLSMIRCQHKNYSSHPQLQNAWCLARIRCSSGENESETFRLAGQKWIIFRMRPVDDGTSSGCKSESPSQNLQSTGSCEHVFCQDCSQLLGRQSQCMECGTVVFPRDVKSHNHFNQLYQLAVILQQRLTTLDFTPSAVGVPEEQDERQNENGNPLFLPTPSFIVPTQDNQGYNVVNLSPVKDPDDQSGQDDEEPVDEPEVEEIYLLDNSDDEFVEGKMPSVKTESSPAAPAASTTTIVIKQEMIEEAVDTTMKEAIVAVDVKPDPKIALSSSSKPVARKAADPKPTNADSSATPRRRRSLRNLNSNAVVQPETLATPTAVAKVEKKEKKNSDTPEIASSLKASSSKNCKTDPPKSERGKKRKAKSTATLKVGDNENNKKDRCRSMEHYPIFENNVKKAKVAADKRNWKGETQLHIACIKGNPDRIEELLENGASPNAVDNSGWTPLHEAAHHNRTECMELLIRAENIIVNCVGRENGQTPLHFAVEKGHLDAVRCLLQHGADPNARDLHGITPVQLAEENVEIKKILQGSKKSSHRLQQLDFDRMQRSETLADNMVLTTSSLGKSEERESLVQFCSQFGAGPLADDVDDRTTHVIVGEGGPNGEARRTVKVLKGVLKGLWIVNFDWVRACLNKKRLLPEDPYEVTAISNPHEPDEPAGKNVPQIARHNRLSLKPGLLYGCHFYLMPCDKYRPAKSDLDNLIEAGGGKLLRREPSKDLIFNSFNTVPFHSLSTTTTTNSSKYFCSLVDAIVSSIFSNQQNDVYKRYHRTLSFF